MADDGASSPSDLEFSLDSLAVGDTIWASDPQDAFVPAEVVAIDDSAVTVRITASGSEVRVPKGPVKRKTGKVKKSSAEAVRLLPREDGEAGGDEGVENMDNLTHLHEASILANIKKRFLKDLIYTSTGPILIALNPYKWLDLYGDEITARYHAAGAQSSTQLPPHCFATGEATLARLREEGRSSSVIICGESGAGKTETTKLILSYLSRVASRSQGDAVAKRIMDSNPVMEAFGNAKTTRNNNSSRFGKFVRVFFSGAEAPPSGTGGRRASSSSLGAAPTSGLGSHPVIEGATITNYLLEKSRVVGQGRDERNYHVFYQLVAGAEGQERKDLGLDGRDARSFRALVGGDCCDVSSIDDKREWGDTQAALRTLGMRGEQAQSMNRVLASVLHLQQLDVLADHGAASPGKGTASPASGAGGSGADASSIGRKGGSGAALQLASKLLGVPADDLAAGLTVRVIHTADGDIDSPLAPAKAAAARGALCKAMYSRLFDWMIRFINSALLEDAPGASERGTGEPTSDASPRMSSKEVTSLPFVGILDIYGFENMATNGFEQLFINYANEKLQNLFNLTVFRSEEKVYRDEGIEFSGVEFPDNQSCLDLIEKRSARGIFHLIDEECLLGKGSDPSLAAKMHRTHAKHKHYEPAGPSTRYRGSNVDFVVKHYAGPIVYECKDFVEKNRDTLYSSLSQLLGHSTNPFVAELFTASASSTSENGRSSIARKKSRTDSLLEDAEDQEGASEAGSAPSSPALGAARGGGRQRRKTGLQQTVAQRFRHDIGRLTQTVSSTYLRFVRCIKSTSTQRPGVIEAPLVMSQLVNAGVMAALEMRRAGFPTRMQHVRFAQRFVCILPIAERRRHAAAWGLTDSSSSPTSPSSQACRPMDRSDVAALVDGLTGRREVARANVVRAHFRVGKTQVFMRANVLARLDSVQRGALRAAADRIGTGYRSIKAKRAFESFRRTIVALQSLARGRRTRRVLGLRISARRCDTRCKRAAQRAEDVLERIPALQKSVRDAALDDFEAQPLRDVLQEAREDATKGRTRLAAAADQGLSGLATAGASSRASSGAEIEEMLREKLPSLEALVEEGAAAVARAEELTASLQPLLDAAVDLHDKRVHAADRGAKQLGEAWAPVILAVRGVEAGHRPVIPPVARDVAAAALAVVSAKGGAGGADVAVASQAELGAHEADDMGEGQGTKELAAAVREHAVQVSILARDSRAGAVPEAGRSLPPFVRKSEVEAVLVGFARGVAMARRAVNAPGDDWEQGLEACGSAAGLSAACVAAVEGLAAWTHNVVELRSKAKGDLVTAEAVLGEAEAELGGRGGEGPVAASQATKGAVAAGRVDLRAAQAAVHTATDGGAVLRGSPEVRNLLGEGSSDADVEDASMYHAWAHAAAACQASVASATSAREAVQQERSAREGAESARAQAMRDLLAMAHETIALAGRVATYHTLVPTGVAAPGSGLAVAASGQPAAPKAPPSRRRQTMQFGSRSPLFGGGSGTSSGAATGASRRRASVRASIVLAMPAQGSASTSSTQAKTLAGVEGALRQASEAGVGATGHVCLAAQAVRAAILRLRKGTEGEKVLGVASGLSELREEDEEDEEDEDSNGEDESESGKGRVSTTPAGRSTAGSSSMGPAELLEASESGVKEGRMALEAAHAAAEKEVDLLARDLQQRHGLVDRLTEATDALLEAEESAHATAISTLPSVSSALDEGRAASAAARKRMAVTMRRQLPELERAVAAAEAATAHAAKEVASARAGIDAAEDERSRLRGELHPILSRVAALTAAVEVGQAAVRTSQRVIDGLMRAHAAAERANVALTGRGRGDGGVKAVGDGGHRLPRGLDFDATAARKVVEVAGEQIDLAEEAVRQATEAEEARVEVRESVMHSLASASAGLQSSDVVLTQLAEQGSPAVQGLTQAVTEARVEVDNAIQVVENDGSGQPHGPPDLQPGEVLSSGSTAGSVPGSPGRRRGPLSAQQLQLLGRQAASRAEEVQRMVRAEEERVAEARRIRAEAAAAAQERREQEAESARARLREEAEARRAGLELLDEAHQRLASVLRRREAAELHWCGMLGAALLEAEQSIDRTSSLCAVANPALALGAARSALQRVAASEHLLENVLGAIRSRDEETRALAASREQVSGMGEELAVLWNAVSRAGVEEEAAAAEAEVAARATQAGTMSGQGRGSPGPDVSESRHGADSAASFESSASMAMAAAESRTRRASQLASFLDEPASATDGTSRAKAASPSRHVDPATQRPTMLESPFPSVRLAAGPESDRDSSPRAARDKPRSPGRADRRGSTGRDSSSSADSAITTADRVLASLPTAVGDVLREAEVRHEVAVGCLDRIEALVGQCYRKAVGTAKEGASSAEGSTGLQERGGRSPDIDDADLSSEPGLGSPSKAQQQQLRGDLELAVAEAKGSLTLAVDALRGAVDAARLVVERELGRLADRREAQRDARQRRRVLAEGKELLHTAAGRLQALRGVFVAGRARGDVIRDREVSRLIERAARRVHSGQQSLDALGQQEGKELDGSIRLITGAQESKSGSTSEDGAPDGGADESSSSDGEEQESDGSLDRPTGRASPMTRAKFEARVAMKRARAVIRQKRRAARREAKAARARATAARGATSPTGSEASASSLGDVPSISTLHAHIGSCDGAVERVERAVAAVAQLATALAKEKDRVRRLKQRQASDRDLVHQRKELVKDRMLQYIKKGGRCGLVRSEVRGAAAIAMRCDDASRPAERLVAAAADGQRRPASKLVSDRLSAVVRGRREEAADAALALHSIQKVVPVWTESRRTPKPEDAERLAREGSGRASERWDGSAGRHMTGSIASSAAKNTAVFATSRQEPHGASPGRTGGSSHMLSGLMSGAAMVRGGGVSLQLDRPFGGLNLSKASYTALGLSVEQVEAAKRGVTDLQNVRSRTASIDWEGNGGGEPGSPEAVGRPAHASTIHSQGGLESPVPTGHGDSNESPLSDDVDPERAAALRSVLGGRPRVAPQGARGPTGGRKSAAGSGSLAGSRIRAGRGAAAGTPRSQVDPSVTFNAARATPGDASAARSAPGDVFVRPKNSLLMRSRRKKAREAELKRSAAGKDRQQADEQASRGGASSPADTGGQSSDSTPLPTTQPRTDTEQRQRAPRSRGRQRSDSGSSRGSRGGEGGSRVRFAAPGPVATGRVSGASKSGAAAGAAYRLPTPHPLRSGSQRPFADDDSSSEEDTAPMGVSRGDPVSGGGLKARIAFLRSADRSAPLFLGHEQERDDVEQGVAESASDAAVSPEKADADVARQSGGKWAKQRKRLDGAAQFRSRDMQGLRDIMATASTPGADAYGGKKAASGLSRGQAAIKRELSYAAAEGSPEGTGGVQAPPQDSTGSDGRAHRNRGLSQSVEAFMPGTPLGGGGRYAAAAEAAVLTSPEVAMGASVRRGSGLLSGAASMLGVDLNVSGPGRRAGSGSRRSSRSSRDGGSRLLGGAALAVSGKGLFGDRRLSVTSVGSRSVASAGGGGYGSDTGGGPDDPGGAREAVRHQFAAEQRERARTEAAAEAMAASALKVAKRTMAGESVEQPRARAAAGQTQGLADAGSPAQDAKVRNAVAMRSDAGRFDRSKRRAARGRSLYSSKERSPGVAEEDESHSPAKSLSAWAGGLRG